MARVEFNVLNEKLAIAESAPTSWWIGKRVGTNNDLYYPQALVKQGIVPVVPWKQDATDIFIRINSKIKWRFSGEKGILNSFKNDLEETIAHELTHGLGFTSQISDYKELHGRKISYLAPAIVPSTISQARVIPPPSVFDSLIWGTQSFATLGRVVSSFQDTRMLDKEELFKTIENDEIFMNAAQYLYDMAISGNVNIKLPNGNVVPLQSTKGKFVSGESLSHVKSSLSNTEYLMKPSTQWTAIGKTDKAYGPLTLKIMEALGYATASNPEVLRFETLSKP